MARRGGSEPRLGLEPKVRLEVNKGKARARLSLNSKSSDELFLQARRGSKRFNEAQKGLFFSLNEDIYS
jgi:hypothetical protein